MSQMMPDQLPPQLAGLLTPGQDQEDTQEGGQLEALQQVITDLHQLLLVLKDAGDAQVAAQCFQGLMKVQQRLMSQGGPSGPQPQG